MRSACRNRCRNAAKTNKTNEYCAYAALCRKHSEWVNGKRCVCVCTVSWRIFPSVVTTYSGQCVEAMPTVARDIAHTPRCAGNTVSESMGDGVSVCAVCVLMDIWECYSGQRLLSNAHCSLAKQNCVTNTEANSFIRASFVTVNCRHAHLLCVCVFVYVWVCVCVFAMCNSRTTATLNHVS